MAIDKVTSAALETSTNQPGFRNLIINGDMSIAQRSTSASSITSSGYHALDRHRLAISSLGTWTISQSTDVPSAQGFAKSMKFDCTTADASPSASDVMWVQHRIEGQNLQYLKKGTSSAESTTLSFWVKSNKTGTYIAELEDTDNSRHIAKSYTIDSADTWEKKTITFDGDTTGTLTNDNNTSLELHLYLGAGTNYTSGTLATSWSSNTDANRAVGQVNLADSTRNDWYITGVQLEVGSAASDFEFLPVDVNLQRCLRYYELLASGDNQVLFDAFYYTATEIRHVVHPKVSMRANPTLDQTSGTDYYRFIRDAANDKFEDFSLDISTPTAVEFFNSTDMSGTQGESGWVRTDVSSSFIALDAEL
jgi:hypothetical protein